MIERLTVANFLCSAVSNPLLAYCLDKFSLLNADAVETSIKEKIAKIKNHYSQFNMEKIFPFSMHLSDQINQVKFIESFLHQPKLWIRIRKDFRDEVWNELNAKNISFEADELDPLSVSLFNTTSLEKTDSYLNGFFEIQDWSSQQTIKFIQPKPNESWWDACAGSGGKSMMMLDAEPTVKILATDNRESILKNLNERFTKVGIKNFKTFQLDLTKEILKSEILNPKSEILADVPCTGSGTWSRTPEWLSMFDENSISQLVSSQRKIIKNLSATMRKGRTLVYITCSVFKNENENNVRWFEANTDLVLRDLNYIEGIDISADSMFVAKFIKQ